MPPHWTGNQPTQPHSIQPNHKSLRKNQVIDINSIHQTSYAAMPRVKLATELCSSPLCSCQILSINSLPRKAPSFNKPSWIPAKHDMTLIAKWLKNLVFRHQGYLKTRGNMGQIMSTLITGDLKQKMRAKLLLVPLERVAPESVPANHDCERGVRYKCGWRNTLSCTIGAGLGSWNIKMLWPDLPRVCCCSKVTHVLYIYNHFSYFAHGYTTTMLLIQDSR